MIARQARVRPGHRLRVLDARVSPRRPRLRDRHRQALRRVCHRSTFQTAGDRALDVRDLRRRLDSRTPRLPRARHACPRPRAHRVLHAPGGLWRDRQVVPKWFVDETAAPTHTVTGPEMRFKINAQTFSHGWELPARLDGDHGRGMPADARFKPGSGGQLLAFVRVLTSSSPARPAAAATGPTTNSSGAPARRC